MPQYPKEQILQLYKGLPEDLREALNSDKTMDAIERLSKEYHLSGKQISKLVDLVGQVLMGLLLPDEFQQDLEKKAGLKKDVAKKVALEIQRFVFYPVKQSLSALYQMEITQPEPEKPPIEKKPKSKDVYREAVE